VQVQRERFNKMGHDIFSYDLKKVTYLRRSMWSKTIKVLYELLGAEDSFQSVSGNGDYHFIEKETFELALKQLPKSALKHTDEEDYKDYSAFIQSCINYCKLNKKDGLLIQFT